MDGEAGEQQETSERDSVLEVGTSDLLACIHLLMQGGERVMDGQEGEFEACHYCGKGLYDDNFDISEHEEDCAYVKAKQIIDQEG